MTSRWFILGLFLVNLALIAALLMIIWSGRIETLDRSLLFGLVGALLVLTLAFGVSVLRWRLARGRPMFGIGAGLVDIVEIVTGKTLSADAQGVIRWIGIGIGLTVLVVGLALVLVRRANADETEPPAHWTAGSATPIAGDQYFT